MEKKWWQDKICYQIYPKSFMDSNGDGIGDLRGILGKMDYLKDLGIDVIWLSPVYKSPFLDQGYDISDYYAIAEEFGTMEDFDNLLAAAKERDMHIIMDLVINHCSSEHEWFKEAIKNPNGEYGRYFYFRKGVDGKEPSNIRSYFGGNAWELVPGTEDLYYLHMYTAGQPDLNWYNPEVLDKLYEMVNFWLEKGISGFRIDAIMDIDKDISFPSYYEPDSVDGLRFCKILTEGVGGFKDKFSALKKATFDKYDAFTVGECFGVADSDMKDFVGDKGLFSTVFDFETHSLIFRGSCWSDVPEITFDEWKNAIFHGQHLTEPYGLRATVIENHDEPRGASRYLPEFARNDLGKKALATIHLMLRGIPFIYQGQEIGMENMPFSSIEEYNDPNTHMEYEKALALGFSEKEALDGCLRFSRDNARTPMQWSDEVNAGFSSGNPWLPVNPNYKEINVSAQENNPDSVLCYYKKLIALRKAYSDVLTYGRVEEAYDDIDNLIAFYRILDDKKVLILSNISMDEAKIDLGESKATVLLGNIRRAGEIVDSIFKLAPLEALVLKM